MYPARRAYDSALSCARAPASFVPHHKLAIGGTARRYIAEGCLENGRNDTMLKTISHPCLCPPPEWRSHGTSWACFHGFILLSMVCYESVRLTTFVCVYLPANVGVLQTGYEPSETNMYEIALETAGVKHAKKVSKQTGGRTADRKKAGRGGQGCMHA